MKDVHKIKETLLLIAGILFISAGIACNEWVLAALFSSDGIIAVSYRIIIWIADVILISIGFTLLIYRRSLQVHNLVLLIFSVLFCFISFVAFDFFRAYLFLINSRFIDMGSYGNIHVKDYYLGWKLKPDSSGRHAAKGMFDVIYEIDHDGFRKINNTGNPDFSIYFFGDSFTFGHGVSNNDTFSNIIREKFLKDKINIYNAGVNGYGIVQMYQQFLNIENRIKKDDLIVFTPIAADISRNIKDFYFPYFYIYSNFIHFENYPFFDKGVIRPYKLECTTYNKLKLLAFYAPYTKDVWFKINKRFISDTRKESMDMMKIIQHKIEMRGGKFHLFFLPNPAECLRRTYSEDVSGFGYFDIMGFFPSQKTELDKIKFTGDEHWNAKGHEIAARAIVETLINKNIIDKKYLKEPE
ncbi:MAG: SGNH/GDSL hydrolase family protein [Nitrospirae bacterium]|nr:SGNH/GDSL hydrolase family protein [Nitrospirota bacterium]